MGFQNPSKYNNKRAYKAKSSQSNNQKRVNWAKKNSMQKKGARAQAKQINALAKTVDNLDEQLNPKMGRYQLAQGLYYASGPIRIGFTSGVSSPTQVIPLAPAQNAGGPLDVYPKWTRWGPGVSSGTDDNAANTSAFGVSEISTCQRAKCGTMRLELAFSAANEPSPIQVTVQVVTFADEAAATYLTQQYGIGLQNLPVSDATGEISCLGTVGSFPNPSMSGAIALNPAYFQVLKEQRFVLANQVHASSTLFPNTATTFSSDTYKSISWKIPMGTVINSRDRGNWARESADDGYALSSRRFLFITSDNQSIDSESPAINIFASCIMYGQK